MAKEFAKAFYKSDAWQKCRASFIQERRAIDGGMCQRCHEELGYIVHHKVHLDPANILDPAIALNHNNLEFVCKACHDDEHLESHQSGRLLCSFDANGRPVDATSAFGHKDKN